MLVLWKTGAVWGTLGPPLMSCLPWEDFSQAWLTNVGPFFTTCLPIRRGAAVVARSGWGRILRFPFPAFPTVWASEWPTTWKEIGVWAPALHGPLGAALNPGLVEGPREPQVTQTWALAEDRMGAHQPVEGRPGAGALICASGKVAKEVGMGPGLGKGAHAVS